MCGFYARSELNRIDFQKLYDVDEAEVEYLKARYNIRPKTPNVVVNRNSPNKAEMMLWFFHPGWPGFPQNRGVINARIESLKEGKAISKKHFCTRGVLFPQVIGWSGKKFQK